MSSAGFVPVMAPVFLLENAAGIITVLLVGVFGIVAAVPFLFKTAKNIVNYLQTEAAFVAAVQRGTPVPGLEPLSEEDFDALMFNVWEPLVPAQPQPHGWKAKIEKVWCTVRLQVVGALESAQFYWSGLVFGIGIESIQKIISRVMDERIVVKGWATTSKVSHTDRMRTISIGNCATFVNRLAVLFQKQLSWCLMIRTLVRVLVGLETISLVVTLIMVVSVQPWVLLALSCSGWTTLLLFVLAEWKFLSVMQQRVDSTIDQVHAENRTRYGPADMFVSDISGRLKSQLDSIVLQSLQLVQAKSVWRVLLLLCFILLSPISVYAFVLGKFERPTVAVEQRVVLECGSVVPETFVPGLRNVTVVEAMKIGKTEQSLVKTAGDNGEAFWFDASASLLAPDRGLTLRNETQYAPFSIWVAHVHPLHEVTHSLLNDVLLDSTRLGSSEASIHGQELSEQYTAISATTEAWIRRQFEAAQRPWDVGSRRPWMNEASVMHSQAYPEWPLMLHDVHDVLGMPPVSLLSQYRNESWWWPSKRMRWTYSFVVPTNPVPYAFDNLSLVGSLVHHNKGPGEVYPRCRWSLPCNWSMLE